MTRQFDIAVVGMGAAGIAAAVTAARAGCSVLALDRAGAAGGTGGFSGLTTLCGLLDGNGQWLNNGFAREFAEELKREDEVGDPLRMGRVMVQLYRPESFQSVAARLIAHEPRIETQWRTAASDLTVRKGHIESLNGTRVGAVVDCSGVAEVCRAAGEDVQMTDETTQSPAVVFSLENVQRDLRSPVGMAMVLLHVAHSGLPALSFMPSADNNAVVVKFSGTPAQVPTLIQFLRAEVSGFENCRSRETEFTLARRSGAMVLGRYVLTGDDVLSARKFPDAVARGCWPVEQWSADGRQHIRYLPANEHYEIPARSLRARQIENLFVAGKSISADVDAIASARVIGCCLATGAAAGKLSAQSIQTAGTR
jgi:hypothetical protein